MFENQKHAFWQALLITIIIFSLGIIAGFILENWRTAKLDDVYKESEVDLLDVKLQADIYSLGYFNCIKAVNENILFADRVYEEAKTLERFQKASVLTKDMELSHRKYDILRAVLFTNSIKIKESCKEPYYYEVVYFYKYNNDQLDFVAKQTVFSKLLSELKEREGNKILLIPIAVDTNVTSVNILLDKYNISKDEAPLILINRKTKIIELTNINDLAKYFEENNQSVIKKQEIKKEINKILLSSQINIIL
ncbi:MAG: hypothetical protein Q8N99_04935 [Nanoarchaeota archaeon]|nr:hypothetical protein [Nanoarchaeota archaeon]